MDRGQFGTFDYDRDYLQPEPQRKTRNPDDWVFVGGRWVYYEED